MNIRKAILKAADHIEANPKRFDFDSVNVPRSPGCGTPGCAIGWIAHFARVRSFREILPALVGIDSGLTFYTRLDEYDYNWHKSAQVCAAALRYFADKYHPAPGVRGIPKSVRAIFETEQSAVVC